MRRTGLLLASLGLVVLLASGVALAATVSCVAGEDYCVGTNAADTINGSEVRDKILGQGGDDKLYGNGGNDSLSGGLGNDNMNGRDGQDSAVGGTGNDVIRGGLGNDSLSFSDGDGLDRLFGDDGDDYINDYSSSPVTSNAQPNVLSGGAGDDDLTGHSRLYGGPGNDYLDGYSYWSQPRGTTRTFDGGPGVDTITSRNNTNDTVYAVDGERDIISCGAGTDTVYFDAGVDSVNPASCENRRGR